MATFPKASGSTPSSIRLITVTLSDKPAYPGDPAVQAAYYRVQIMDQFGQEMQIEGNSGDLVPYLSSTDITWLIDFMSRLRALAVAGFLAP